ncbi:MAG: diguanylate cyclase [Marinobacter sp.]|nr:diguanylate cyclase [Marinobacter sp.]
MLFLLPAVTAQAEAGKISPVTITADDTRKDVSLYLSYLEDVSSGLSFEQVVARWSRDASHTKPERAYNFGFTNSTYWFHLQIENLGPERRFVLEGLYPIIDEMELFLARSGGEVTSHLAGDTVPFANRSLSHHNINYTFDLAAGEVVDAYLRVATTGSIQMRMLLWDYDTFVSASRKEGLLLGGYYGLMSAMLIFNLLIFLSIRDKNYLWYSSYIGIYAVLQLSLNGLAFEFLWSGSPWWNNRAVAFLTSVGMFTVLGFTNSFLAMRVNAPHLSRLFGVLCGLFAVLAAMALLYPDYSLVIRLATLFATIAILFVFWAAVICWYRGYVPARYFLLAWVALLFGMICYTLKTFALLPANFFTDHAIQIGSAIEVVLLSIALADRLRHLARENERIQVAMQHELEVKVTQRTEALAQANRELEALSHIDGLTGVFNRRYFDQRLGEECGRQSREGPLSLIMLDVDHFKRFNDEHGHQAGDACLMEIARRLQDLGWRSADRVARYGGEEFAVILPCTTADGALMKAQQILEAVRAEPVSWGGKSLRVTVSLGVATADQQRGAAPASLIAAADKALYEAKAAGRNQACTQEPAPMPAMGKVTG